MKRKVDSRDNVMYTLVSLYCSCT